MTKELTGRDWTAADAFTFTLTVGDEATRQAAEEGAVILPDNAGGLVLNRDRQTAAFGDIRFTREGSRIFANHYAASGEWNLQGTKYFSGREFRSGDAFTFTVAAPEGTPMPQSTQVTIRPDSGSSAQVDFGNIHFTSAGVYTYTVAEVPGDLPGVVYDTEAKTVTVEVKDNGDGTMTVAPSWSGGDALRWNNRYEVQAAPAMDITGKKQVTPEHGSFIQQGGEFAFILTPAETNPDGDPLSSATVYNQADGSILFGTDVRYGEAGTYRYTLREVQTQSVPGISSDASVYELTVSVTENL